MAGAPFTPLARADDPSPEGWRARGDEPAIAFPVPWRWWEAVGVFLISFVVANLLALALLLAAPALGLPGPVGTLLLAVVTSGTLLGTSLAWVRALHPAAVGRLFGPVRRRARDVLVGLGYGLVAFLVGNLAWGPFVQWLIRRRGGEVPAVQEALQEAVRDPVSGWFLMAVVVVLAPLAEETFFRGMLFQTLRRSVPLWPAMGLSGLAFASNHGEPLVIVTLLPIGMFFAWVFHRSGSLLVAIAAHGAFNLVGVVLLRLPEDWAARLLDGLGLAASI